MSFSCGLTRFKLGKHSVDVDRAIMYLVKEAFRNVSLYRKLWQDANVALEDIHGTRDLELLPPLFRFALRDTLEEERVNKKANLSKCVHTSTSGYLGVPLTIHMSKGEALFRKMTLIRTFRRYVALPLPLRIADVGPMVPPHRRGLEQSLRLARILRLPATVPVEDMVAYLAPFRPHVLEGYPTCLELLAERLEGRQTPPIRPRLVVARGEVLHEETRSILAQVFRAPVADLYSSEEGGNMAWSCPEDPRIWHVNLDACVLEVVDRMGKSVPPGEQGQVLLTNLFNWTMPFIRYELGDQAKMEPGGPCSCGANGPVLTSVGGRDDDFLVLPDGRRLSPRLVANTVFNALRDPKDPTTVKATVRQFQIVQEELRTVTLRVVLGSPEGQVLAGRALEALGVLLPGITCRLTMVPEIPLTPGGKMKKVYVLVKG